MAQSDPDRIEEIFHAALEVPESERSAFVAKECDGESECIREVMSLLEAHGARGVLDDPVVVLGAMGDLPPGTTIDGRYEIESELQHGGMSRVYVALDTRMNNDHVVVKVLSSDLVQDSYARKHFDQEVEALLRLKHGGVVRATDRGDLTDGRPYIVMDFVDGESLRPQIKNEGMDFKRAASLLILIGEALEYVHKHGVVHRDVKPENIMLRRGTDAVVLIDFGIAKVMDSVVALSTVEGKSAGTLVYMSPEQLLGQGVMAASDVYSLAVVAYEMITGRRPFAPHSHAHLLDLQRKRVRAKPTDLRPGLPKKAEQIILRALSFDPKNRYQSAKRFGDELAAALNESTVIDEPSRTWKWLKVVAAVLILALLSYGIYWYVDHRGESPQLHGLIATPTPSPTPTQTQGFNCWLLVQSTRDGKDYGNSYKSNGDDKFENSDKYQLNLRPLYSGYVYIFNEGPSATGGTNFRLVYPKPVNDSSAYVGANQTVLLDWNTFRGPAGTDNYWFVWAAEPVSELESAKDEAQKHSQGVLTGETLVKVNDYLTKMANQVEAKALKIKASQEIQVRKPSYIVLTLAKFEHR